MSGKSSPLVSVVIPAHNAERTIKHAITSALAQTYSNIEIIVCDDASSDNTALVVNSIQDRRIHLLRNQNNEGPGPSRDYAIACARGNWIALLDADDSWLPDRLEIMLSGAKRNEIIFDDTLLCHDTRGALVPGHRLHGKRAFGSSGSPTIVELSQFLRADRLLIHPLLPIRELRALGLKHSKRRFGEDAEFYISLALSGVNMRYVPMPLYLYRITPGSLTSDPTSRGEMSRMLSKFLEDPGIPTDVRASLKHKISRLALDEEAHDVARRLKNGQILTAFKKIALNPSILKRIMLRLPDHARYEIRRLIARAPSR